MFIGTTKSYGYRWQHNMICSAPAMSHSIFVVEKNCVLLLFHARCLLCALALCVGLCVRQEVDHWALKCRQQGVDSKV